MLFDIHVHTTLSPCSVLPLEEILARARERGLDGVCITDHDTMAVRELVREGLQPDGICVVIGMEYATPEGDFLLFGPFEALEPGLGAGEVLPLVHRAGGVAVGAHPFRPGRELREWVLRDGLCRLVEEVNGRNPAGRNAPVRELVARHGLHGCGGSDAHTAEELGRVATRIDAPVTSRDDFIQALRHGRCAPARIRLENCRASRARHAA